MSMKDEQMHHIYTKQFSKSHVHCKDILCAHLNKQKKDQFYHALNPVYMISKWHHFHNKEETSASVLKYTKSVPTSSGSHIF